MSPLHPAVRTTPPEEVLLPPAPKLTRQAIEKARAQGRTLLVQGGMGLHASDGLAGKVAAATSRAFLPVGTISAVGKTEAGLVGEIRRARKDAPEGYIGVNLMAAIHKDDFESLAKAALDEGVSFLVQGAGISREILRWCRDAATPFVGIVASGRLAKTYERWGAELVVVEGPRAGGHIGGDMGDSLEGLVREVRASCDLPIVAAGGVVGGDIPTLLEAGACGVQMATRFLACSDGDAHPNFKAMHLGKSDDDVVVIQSCVKGMQARAIRNPFTEALAQGAVFPPKAKAWFYGRGGYRGRRKSCIDCLAKDLCLSRESQHKESFCITDALLRAAIEGDMESGLFFSGSSVARIPEKTLDELRDAQRLVHTIEAELEAERSTRRHVAQHS